jgi:hypothetical protein
MDGQRLTILNNSCQAMTFVKSSNRSKEQIETLKASDLVLSAGCRPAGLIVAVRIGGY